MAPRRTGGGGKTPGKERRTTADEDTLWRYAVREITPLRRGEKMTRPAQRQVNYGKSAPKRTGPNPALAPSAALNAQPLSGPPGIGHDKRNAQRLKRGRTTIDGRLDLHGMTLDEAHGALDGFLDRADRAGKRCLLVITGKGRGATTTDWHSDSGFGVPRTRGVLRDAVPRWLQTGLNRQRVLATEPARPQHGGDGALYVLLRRKRT
ncbi:MAG: Smr/MutS family protein [Rhodospirillales bacterium]|nr:Smr/MutS family protein [Rhodospirillales bacterium]